VDAADRQLLDAVPVALVAWQAAGDDAAALILRYANRAACAAAGFDLAAAAGRSFAELLPGSGRCAPAILDACRTQEERIVELPYSDTRVRHGWWRGRLRPVGDRTVLMAYEDVSEEKERLRALRASERLNRAIVERLQEAVLVARPDGTILQANAALARLCRVPEIAVGTNVRDIRVELLDLDGRPLALDDTPRMRALRGETVRGAVVRVTYPDGGAAWVEVNASALADEDGEAYGCLITYEDVSERFEADRRARHEADHDPLTGVANRRALDRTLAAAVARAGRAGHTVAVLVTDLDGFKAVNDRHGHGAGDATLREVAARLRASVRERDLVARVGGDEFVLVLADLEPSSAAAERCRARITTALAEPWAVAGVDVPLRAAIGVAHYPADGREGGALIAHADREMYAAKG
jgi:diguanylate cyclase (GGDEF)-like protein/PAS domain S-box-containing protein